MGRNFVIVSALLPVFACVGIVHANADDEATAAFERGKRAFINERFIEAADAFRRAYALRPAWKLLYNIGQADAAGKRFGPALDAFEQYLAEGGDEISPERQSQILKENARLRGIVGFVKVLSPNGAVIYIDGVARGEAPFTRELPVAAAVSHTIRMVVDGQHVERSFQVNVGRTITISLFSSSDGTLSPLEERRETSDSDSATDKRAVTDSAMPSQKRSLKKTLGLVYIGVGAAFVVGGSITGGLALNKNSAVRDKCSDHVCYEDDYGLLNRRNRLATTSSVLFAVGGAATAVGIIFLILARRDRTEAPLALVPMPGALLIEGRF